MVAQACSSLLLQTDSPDGASFQPGASSFWGRISFPDFAAFASLNGGRRSAKQHDSAEVSERSISRSGPYLHAGSLLAGEGLAVR